MVLYVVLVGCIVWSKQFTMDAPPETLPTSVPTVVELSIIEETAKAPETVRSTIEPPSIAPNKPMSSLANCEASATTMFEIE